MTEAAPNFENVLREALSPVDPPVDLAVRLEDALRSITELAADELQEWELAAMRDPRNWARPVAAAVVGTAAGTALVLLSARRRAQAKVSRGVTQVRAFDRARQGAEQTLRDASTQARKLLSGPRSRP